VTKTCEFCGRAYTPSANQSRARRETQRFCSRQCRLRLAQPPEASRWTKADGENPPPRRDAWPCRSQPGGCGCHCHALVKGKARSARRARDAWLPEHDALILEMVKRGEAPAAIAEALSVRFPIPRSEQGVRRRLVRLGISTRDGWWSRWETSRMLGVSKDTLARLEGDGLLEPQPFATWRRYRADDIERLVREQAGHRIDPRRVRDPRLRSLAEVSALVNARTA
jgi:hypothetical protein